MRYFVFMAVTMSSLVAMAADSMMSFRIRELGANQYEYSSTWNPVTQEAVLRVGLVVDAIDPHLADKNISFASARKAEFIAQDWPELGEECQVVSDWNFDYSPGLPHYLMFMTLKGPGCQRVADLFDFLQVRLRFLGVSLVGFESVDVSVEIRR